MAFYIWLLVMPIFYLLQLASSYKALLSQINTKMIYSFRVVTYNHLVRWFIFRFANCASINLFYRHKSCISTFCRPTWFQCDQYLIRKFSFQFSVSSYFWQFIMYNVFRQLILHALWFNKKLFFYLINLDKTFQIKSLRF